MKCAGEIAKTLFPDAGIPDAGWRAKWQMFRAAYPAKKRSTKAERGEQAMRQLNPDDALFGRMLAALETHKRSERWEDAAFIPHMASWINGRYWEHDLAEYRPATEAPRRVAQRSAQQCPECGRSWRVHLTHPSRQGQQPNAEGSYCG